MYSTRKTSQTLDSKRIRSELTPMTDISVGYDIVNTHPNVNPLGDVDLGMNVTSIYTGVIGAEMGILRIHHGATMPTKTEEQKALKGIVLSAGVAQVTAGVIKTSGNVLTIAGAKVISTAAKTSITAAASTTLKIGGGLSTAYLALIMVPVCMGIDKTRVMLEKLKKDDTSIDMKKLHALAPKTFENLSLENKSYIELSEVQKKEIIKELEASQVENGVVLSILLLTLIGAVLGIVFTGGTGAIIASIVGTVAGIAMAGNDTSSMIKALQNAKSKMSDLELVIKIITVILGVVSLVLAVYYAPTVALAIASGTVGALLNHNSINYYHCDESKRSRAFRKRAVSANKG